MKVYEIQERMVTLQEQATALRDAADAENRDLTTDELQELNRLMDKFDSLAKQLETAKRLEAQSERFTKGTGRLVPPPPIIGANGLASRIDEHGNRTYWNPKRAQMLAEHARHCGWRELNFETMRDNLDREDDGGFCSLAEQLLAVKLAAQGRFDTRLERFEAQLTPMAEGVGSQGGFLVAPRFVNELLLNAREDAEWLSMRRVFQFVGTSTMIWPRLPDEDRSGDAVAGIALTRVGEGSTLSEAPIELQQINMVKHKAAKLIRVSNELLEDAAVGVESVVREVFARALTMRQAMDFFTGNGAGMPQGITTGGDKYEVVSGTAAGSLAVSDVAGMLARLEPGGGDSRAWVCHPSVLPALAALKVGEYPVWSANQSGELPMSLYGIPLFTSDSCKTLNTPGDIWLCNLNRYLYGIGEVTVEASRDAAFTTDQTLFRLRLRDDGRPARNSTRTDRQDYAQANFVHLDTRS